MFLYNVYIVHVLVRIKFLTPTPFILFSKSRGFLKQLTSKLELLREIEEKRGNSSHYL